MELNLQHRFQYTKCFVAEIALTLSRNLQSSHLLCQLITADAGKVPLDAVSCCGAYSPPRTPAGAWPPRTQRKQVLERGLQLREFRNQQKLTMG